MRRKATIFSEERREVGEGLVYMCVVRCMMDHKCARDLDWNPAPNSEAGGHDLEGESTGPGGRRL